MISSRIVIIVSALTIVSLVAPLQADNATLKDKYRAAEVDPFDVQPGVEFPPKYVADLQEQILKELEKSKEFQELLRPGQNPVTADSPVLRLTGTIGSFNPGSRKKRYVVGYGAGAAEIYAHVVFLDRSTGRTLMTEEVRAVLSGGFFGGNAMNATQNFAKQVVNTTKLSLRKRLSTEHDSEGTHNAGSAALDRQQLTISSKDWEGAERTLNEEGAAGYHLVEVRITGKNSANVVLERLSPKPDAYQYRLFHPYLYTSLQKDLNGAAEDGFRFCRHTLMALGNRFVLVAEKPVLPSAPRYSYRVHGTARISSAQHDIEKDQADGYTFIEEGEGPVHMFVLEKLVTAEKSSQTQSRPGRATGCECAGRGMCFVIGVGIGGCQSSGAGRPQT